MGVIEYLFEEYLQEGFGEKLEEAYKDGFRKGFQEGFEKGYRRVLSNMLQDKEIPLSDILELMEDYENSRKGMLVDLELSIANLDPDLADLPQRVLNRISKDADCEGLTERCARPALRLVR